MQYLGGVFNSTIIPLALVGYEMIIANSALRASLAVYHLISNYFMAVDHVGEYHLLTIRFELQPLSLHTPL